jgi:hypothetical protein
VWLLCVNSASGSHCYEKDEAFFPPWTQYLSSGLATPLLAGHFFAISRAGTGDSNEGVADRRQHREAADTITILKATN